MLEVIEFPALKEAQAKADAKRAELKSIFDEAGPDRDMTKVKSIDGDSQAKVEFIRTLNTELNALQKDVEDNLVILKGAENAAESKDAAEAGEKKDAVSDKSPGEQFVKSAALKQKGQTAMLDVELKTLFSRSAGWTPESVRSGLVVLSAQRPVQVTDLLPSIPTTQAAYKYMEETTFTNNAAEKAEGDTYGEAAFVLTERSATVEKITVWVPVTDEQLEDEEGAAAYLDARLPFMIAQRLDSQILVGDGSTPNIRGVNNASSIQSQAKGVDPVPDAVYKGMTKVRVTGRAIPGAVVFHPNDWQDVKLLRTADGIYIWGSPSEATPDRIWGLPVALSDAQTENTAVVGDFANFSLLVVRRGIEVKVSDSHGEFFINGKQAVRADMRAATVWTRGAAFCKVTGI